MATVLIIEDEHAIRDLVTEILASCDIRTVSADHPSQVRDNEGPFDLVLADLVEQQGRGFEPEAVRNYVGRLRTQFAAPVVLFTAHSPSVVGDPAEVGAAGVIAKPFDVDELGTLVASFVRQRPTPA